MLDSPAYEYDAATAMTQGRRDRQEDAVLTHFPAGTGLGYIVLADGMGGHAGGHVASEAVVQEVYRGLLTHTDDPDRLEHDAGFILHTALYRANSRVARLAGARPELRGMGATVLAPMVVGNRLYWISVGDSPLYLLRDGRMARLNQVHSLLNRMRELVAEGRLTQQEAEGHPDRDCLTSVVVGSTIAEIDCRDCPIDLRDGDILIAASDGLQFIADTRIAELVYAHRDETSAEIGNRLLEEIASLDHPDQDNVSLCVLKIREKTVVPLRVAAKEHGDQPPARRATLHSYVQIHSRRRGEQLSCQVSSVRER